MRHVDNIILGAGPAGLQLGHLLQERGERYLIIERSSRVGSFFSRFPRHGKLLSINKVYTGCEDRESRRRYDWNSLLCDDPQLQFARYSRDYFPSASALCQYLEDFARVLALEVLRSSPVVRVRPRADAGGYEIELASGERLTCARLFVGTGLSVERLPAVPGVELCESYGTCSLDPNDFTDQRVMIIGKGNSAFETADNLIGTTRKLWIVGAENVRLAWGTHYVGDVRAVNNNFLDTYQLKAQNNILDGEFRGVRRDPDSGELIAEVYFASRARSFDFRCDRVILCTGFKFDATIFDPRCSPALCPAGKLPVMTSAWESTNCPEMFFIGVLMQARDYRKTMSAFIHGFRHNIEALDMIVERRDHPDRGWRRAMPASRRSDALADLIMERLSTSAALLLQPGFLIDLLGLRHDGGVDYLPSLPESFVHEHLASDYRRLLTISLEYKQHEGYMDPFAMPRGQGVEEDFYLHPIVRCFEDGALIARFFLPDDLDNDWRGDPEHGDRLQRFLEAHLGDPSTRPGTGSRGADPQRLFA